MEDFSGCIYLFVYMFFCGVSYTSDQLTIALSRMVHLDLKGNKRLLIVHTKLL